MTHSNTLSETYVPDESDFAYGEDEWSEWDHRRRTRVRRIALLLAIAMGTMAMVVASVLALLVLGRL